MITMKLRLGEVKEKGEEYKYHAMEGSNLYFLIFRGDDQLC